MIRPVDDFSQMEEDFLRITGDTVFCSVTTVDAQGRPRSRTLHPIFTVRHGRPLGWADTVFVNCVGSWVTEDAELEEVGRSSATRPRRWAGAMRAWPASARRSGAASSSRPCG